MTKRVVFGHQNPDTDAIAASIAAAYLLNNTLYKEDNNSVVPAILGTPNDETMYAFETFNVAVPKVINETDADEVILVDHNEFSQSVSNISEKPVSVIYDHHKVNFASATPLWMTVQPLGSTSTVLYYQFKQQGIEIPSDIAGMMASAIISDTLLLKSPTTTEMDKPALEDLARIAGIENYEEYGIALLKAGTDLSTRSDLDLLEGDAKSFDMNGKTVRIGQVNTVDINDVLARQESLENVMKSQMAAENYDVFLFVITDILNSNSKGLVIADNADDIAKAYNTVVENNVIDLPGVVSRKKQVVPPLMEIF